MYQNAIKLVLTIIIVDIFAVYHNLQLNVVAKSALHHKTQASPNDVITLTLTTLTTPMIL